MINHLQVEPSQKINKQDRPITRRITLLVPLLVLCGIAALLFSMPTSDAQDNIPRPSPRLQIINGSDQIVDIFWLKSETERIPNGTISPGDDTVITTSLGHQFEIVGRTEPSKVQVTSKVLIQAYRYEPKGKDGIPAFYSQVAYANGFPIVASGKVNPYALKEAVFWVNMMLAKRPDVREAMIKSGARMCIMAHDEYTTDLPEFQRMAVGENREIPGVSNKDFWDARARGLGGSELDPLCTVAEENVLAFVGDPYEKENILIHEFAHNIHLRGMLNVDPTFDPRLEATYQAAMKAGLWKGKYAAVNRFEYFAEGVQSWFDDNRVNDHDHNHVHLRSQLIEYDPGLAAICREVFGDTELKYTKPTTRLTDHMAGYDPSKSPDFVWPERLEKVKTAIRDLAQNRNAKAYESATHEARLIEGWTVIIQRDLSKKDAAALDKALALLRVQLLEIKRVVSKESVSKLQQVRLYFNPPYPNFGDSAEYHPDGDWLKENNRDPMMAQNVEFTNVRVFEEDHKRMPMLALHELSHAYHDRFLPEGSKNPEIIALYEKAKASGKYDKVERRDHLGKTRMDDSYAMTNAAEYFAESTEAFFGTNDFFPYNYEQLKAHDPDMLTLLEKLWGAPLAK